MPAKKKRNLLEKGAMPQPTPAPAPTPSPAKILTPAERGAYSDEQSNAYIAKGGVLADNPAETARIAARRGITVQPGARSIVKGKERAALPADPVIANELYRQKLEKAYNKAKIEQETKDKYEKDKIVADTLSKLEAANAAPPTPEQQASIENIGKLNPEPLAAEPLQPAGDSKLSQILQTGLSDAAIAGGTTATTLGGAALIGAPATAGLTLAGAAAATGVATAGGFIEGVIRGTFAAYKHAETAAVSDTESNVNKAIFNIRQAIITANKGGNTAISDEQFNAAYSELLRARNHYKQLEKQGAYNWATNIRLKQNDLENYLFYTYPGQAERYRLAILKPDPAYVDNDANGVPL